MHDRRRHRRAARRARPEAAGGARRLRPGAHRLVVQQRQRRLRDRVLDRSRICACGSVDGAPQPRTLLPTDGVSPLFQAALEATEEAVYNSLLKATTVTSRFGTAEAMPIDRASASSSRRYPHKRHHKGLDQSAGRPDKLPFEMKGVVIPSFRPAAGRPWPYWPWPIERRGMM